MKIFEKLLSRFKQQPRTAAYMAKEKAMITAAKFLSKLPPDAIVQVRAHDRIFVIEVE